MYAETRRTEAQRRSDLAAKRGPRGRQSSLYGENYGAENINFQKTTTRRPSPRMGSFSNANKAFGTTRGAFNDITNAEKAPHADSINKPFKPLQGPSLHVAVSSTSLVRDMPASKTPDAAITEAPVVEHRGSPPCNPQSVREYAPDIIQQFFTKETKSLAVADYMDRQPDITAKMRMILMDWMIEVHLKYRLRPETLHLTVNLVDRYLSKVDINRKRLQLVGVVAMFIASKFEEITPPELKDWVYITDSAYTQDDVLRVECSMLQVLSFEIVVPTAAHFFDHFGAVNTCSPSHLSMAQYILELGLLDMRMLQYSASHVVAAAVMLSNEIWKRSPVWPDSMSQATRHSEQALRHCAEELRQLWHADKAGAGGQLQAVHKKFSLAQYHSVATMSF